MNERASILLSAHCVAGLSGVARLSILVWILALSRALAQHVLEQPWQHSLLDCEACNRLGNDVTVIDAARLRQIARISAVPEAFAGDISKDKRYLLVANHLPAGRANVDEIAAVVTVLGVSDHKPVKELKLPNGSGQLKALRVSPGGRYAAVTHLIAKHHRPTTRLQMAWMNGNALTLIDVPKLQILGTVLLDDPTSGAANPWGLAWSQDGQKLVVAHSGTQEVSIIESEKLLRAITGKPESDSRNPLHTPRTPYEGMADELPFLVGARHRVKLPPGDLGPREVEVVEGKAYVTNYFSETISVIDLENPRAAVESLSLDGQPLRGTNPPAVTDARAAVLDRMSPERRGEFYFHDAGICFQGWQSCASCHPNGGRVDGLNWDLLNDGLGNPKNTKSLLLAFQTPPAMSLGVRDTAESAVRAGLRHILFTEPREDIVQDISAYIKSLKPAPSPYLLNGKLSESARRGEKVFARAGCAECHPSPLFTDLQRYDVGTRAPYDEPGDRFDTPTLVELWRTAPYLHDGSAATVRDVVTRRNPRDEHGRTSELTSEELDDLCAYLLSL